LRLRRQARRARRRLEPEWGGESRGGGDIHRVIHYVTHMDWNLAAILVLAAVSQAFAAAAWIVIGGLGGQWRINRILVRLQDDIQRTDERVTREVKTRAGREGQEARKEAKSVVDEAKDHLAAAHSPHLAPQKPSTIPTINAGRR